MSAEELMQRTVFIFELEGYSVGVSDRGYQGTRTATVLGRYTLLMLLTLALIIIASRLSPSLLGAPEENP